MEPLIDPVHGHGRYSIQKPLLTKCYAKVIALCKLVILLDVSMLIFCSQSLVNLFVTGHAVSNVWDGDRECSGMSKTSIYCVHTHKCQILTTDTALTSHLGSSVAPDFTHIHQMAIIPTRNPQHCIKSTNEYQFDIIEQIPIFFFLSLSLL